MDEVGGKIPKIFGAYLPQECLDTPLPARSGSTESPKTVTASGICQEESSINMLTGSESNIVIDRDRVGGSINMLTGSESNIVSKEDPEVSNRDGAGHVVASSGEVQDIMCTTDNISSQDLSEIK